MAGREVCVAGRAVGCSKTKDCWRERENRRPWSQAGHGASRARQRGCAAGCGLQALDAAAVAGQV